MNKSGADQFGAKPAIVFGPVPVSYECCDGRVVVRFPELAEEEIMKELGLNGTAFYHTEILIKDGTAMIIIRLLDRDTFGVVSPDDSVVWKNTFDV